MKRTTAPMTFALALACAAASCQRPIEGTPCPCLSGYRCCAAEQACYPEGTRCPSAVPGTQAWTAHGIPTFDPSGNVYISEERALTTPTTSLLDTENGKARWTREGYLQPQCAKDDITVLLQWASDANGVPASVQPLFGVSNATGTPQWSVDVTGSGWARCSADAERAYSFERTESSDHATLNVHATRDGALTWSIPFGGPPDPPFDPRLPPAWIEGQLDHLLIVSFSLAQTRHLQALELPEGQPGSVRWTLPVPGDWLTYLQDGPERIILLISDGDRSSLVRINPSDGSTIWSRSGGDGGAWTLPLWPGMVLLIEELDLVALSSDTGAVLWRYPVESVPGDYSSTEVLSSGEMLIIRKSFVEGADRVFTAYDLLGPDGQLRGSRGPVRGDLYDAGAGQYFHVLDGVLSRVFLDWGGATGWTLGGENGRYVRAIVGHDEEHLFVRIAPESEDACAYSCSQQLAAIARYDGAISWITDPFAAESAYEPFQDVHTDAEHVYVDAWLKGTLATGTLWAFWR